MKRNKFPSLDDLRVFETVARIGSVRGAADELALTHGAVSRRISKLSNDLNVKLVEAKGRGISITKNGQLLAESAQQAFEQISSTLEKIQHTKQPSSLVLSCERSLAMTWLIRRLGQFQEQFPTIPVQLMVGGGHLDFNKDNITLAIRRIDFSLEPHWSIEKIFEESMGPVMQQEMITRFKQGNYIGLATKTRPNAWKNWLAINSSAKAPKEIRYFDHHFLMAEAAASGLGVGMCPKIMVMDDLDKERVIAPAGFSKDGSYYGLIHSREIKQSSDIAKLKQWILSLYP